MKSKNQIRRERLKQRKLEKAKAAADKTDTNETAEHPNSTQLNEHATPGGDTDKQTSSQKSSVTLLARKFDWITEDNPLFDMYSQISSRFKRKREDESKLALTEEDQPKEFNIPAEVNADANADANAASQLSRKKLRQATKPSLAELKQLTSRPELVEWYDADAPHPKYLVYMKTLPNVVQVPPNWRHRLEMPQFGPKQPYKLPQNIASTGIQEARKEDKLNVDYDKMHAAFFSEPQPEPTLLPYGEIVDLKLRMSFKPHASKRATPSNGPPPVSGKLRKALGIKDNEPMPWQEVVSKLGPAPGYAHIISHASSSAPQRWGYLA